MEQERIQRRLLELGVDRAATSRVARERRPRRGVTRVRLHRAELERIECDSLVLGHVSACRRTRSSRLCWSGRTLWHASGVVSVTASATHGAPGTIAARSLGRPPLRRGARRARARRRGAASAARSSGSHRWRARLGSGRAVKLAEDRPGGLCGSPGLPRAPRCSLREIVRPTRSDGGSPSPRRPDPVELSKIDSNARVARVFDDADREPVCLVADPLEELERGIVRIEADGAAVLGRTPPPPAWRVRRPPPRQIRRRRIASRAAASCPLPPSITTRLGVAAKLSS